MAVADLDGVEVELRVYSTAGNAATGAGVAQRAVDEGAQVILGPLYADVAAAVGVAVADDNVPVMSFSNNASVAGGNVFLLGNTFRNTAERVVGYAASQGQGRMVVVHSQDLSGTAARTAVERAAVATGATVVGAVGYELSQAGVINAIPQVRDALRNSGADSIFYTSSYSGALPLFAQLLPENGITPEAYRALGLARWDVPTEALSLPGLQNGWFALPEPGVSAAFESRFQAANGRSPHPLAGLAYDGIAAIGAVARDAGSINGVTLTQPSGFAGVNGVFRLRPDGTTQRALAIAQVVNGQVQVISPAPRSFGSPGS
jgi:hypothetical protein